MRGWLKRETWRDAVWWLRSQHPGLGLIYASAALRRALLAASQEVVMVVGSYGKTTTTRAVRAALGLPANGWAEANPNTLGEVAWSMLREAAWRKHVVIEAGIAAPGQMAQYAAMLRPHTTVVTWLGNEHVRAFGDERSLRSEKADAIRCLPSGGRAVLNADDPHARWMATQTAARVLWYGTTPDCHVWADEIRLDWPFGMRFLLRAGSQSCELRSRLLGRRTIHCLLAAAAVGLDSGRTLSELATELAELQPTRCRLQNVRLPNGAAIIRDEYKATPETVFEALRVLAEVPARRRVVVIGDLDNLPTVPIEPHYEKVGAGIGSIADLVVVVGSGLSKYVAGFRTGGMTDAQMLDAVDVHHAITLLKELVRDGDVILLKGQENDRLSRIALGLSGVDVRCARSTCTAYLQSCDECPLLRCAA